MAMSCDFGFGWKLAIVTLAWMNLLQAFGVTDGKAQLRDDAQALEARIERLEAEVTSEGR